MPSKRHTGSSCRSAPVRRRRSPLGAVGACDGFSLATGQRLPTAQPTGKGLVALSAPQTVRGDAFLT
eukprot:9578632-Alexandrium_andersonii.AAC.1